MKPYLVTSNGERLIKHCEKRLPLMWSSFRERSYFPWIWFRDLRIRFWGFEIKHLKAHNFVWQGLFFFHHSYPRNFDDRLSSNFHRCVLFCAYVDTHQVRRLVFDNYQWCQVSLSRKHCLQIFCQVEMSRIPATSGTFDMVVVVSLILLRLDTFCA